MFSTLLTLAVDGNNCDLHVPAAFPSEKEHRHMLDWLSSGPQFWCWFLGDKKIVFCRTCNHDPSVVQLVA